MNIKSKAEMINMCVVPVTVKHQNSTEDINTFTKEKLLKKLKVTGRKALITLKTLNGENKISATAVEALQVCNSKSSGTWIKMPTVYIVYSLRSERFFVPLK